MVEFEWHADFIILLKPHKSVRIKFPLGNAKSNENGAHQILVSA